MAKQLQHFREGKGLSRQLWYKIVANRMRRHFRLNFCTYTPSTTDVALLLQPTPNKYFHIQHTGG